MTGGFLSLRGFRRRLQKCGTRSSLSARSAGRAAVRSPGRARRDSAGRNAGFAGDRPLHAERKAPRVRPPAGVLDRAWNPRTTGRPGWRRRPHPRAGRTVAGRVCCSAARGAPGGGVPLFSVTAGLLLRASPSAPGLFLFCLPAATRLESLVSCGSSHRSKASDAGRRRIPASERNDGRSSVPRSFQAKNVEPAPIGTEPPR